MLEFWLGLQVGFTKFACFLCLWDNRADSKHYVKIKWHPQKQQFQESIMLLKMFLLLVKSLAAPTPHKIRFS